MFRLAIFIARIMLVLALRMPARARRAHFEPPWRGDRPWGIYHVRRGRNIDQNFHCSADGTAWAGHWGVPLHDNWHFIVGSNGKIRRMSHAELRRPMSHWHDAQIKLWRRGHSVHSARPSTYRELAKIAVQHGVVIYAEIKWYITLAQAKKMVADAHAVGHPPYAMAMLRQSRSASTNIAKDKCANWTKAGGEFRLIYGKGSLGVRNRMIAKRTVATWEYRPAAYG